MTLQAAEFPRELNLASGTTLRDARPERWARDYVVVRYVGGIAPIQYRHIAEAQRATVLACRDEALAKKQKLPAKPSAAQSGQVLEGQAFIVTRGAGNYKLGGMRIYAFPADRIGAFDTNTTVELGDPLATATTDAEGKFKLKLPDTTEFFLFARGQRLAGRDEERYEWCVKSSSIDERTNVLLDNSNHRVPTKSVRISDTVLPSMNISLRHK